MDGDYGDRFPGAFSKFASAGIFVVEIDQFVILSAAEGSSEALGNLYRLRLDCHGLDQARPRNDGGV